MMPPINRSVAVEVSVIAAGNVAAEDTASVAVDVSDTAERKVKSEETLSVAVAVSTMDAL